MTLITTLSSNRKKIIRIFQALYILLFIFLVWGYQSMVYRTNVLFIFYAGVWAGRVSVLLFGITILPGILRRFGIRNVVSQTIMLFRRQLGILVYASGFVHYCFLILFPTLAANVPLQIPPPTYQIFGILALYIMLPLLLTSNDWSVRKLGKWWGRIHSAVYFVAWLIFAHIALQEINVWSVYIGVFAVLETISLLYSSIKKREKTSL